MTTTTDTPAGGCHIQEEEEALKCNGARATVVAPGVHNDATHPRTGVATRKRK
jgi:hypothetical protein